MSAIERVELQPSSYDTKRTIAHEEALEAAHRLINSHFGNENRARCSIPANPDRDDDLVLCAYIRQQSALAKGDDDEIYDFGKRDGYSQAVQDIDILTGGDGEYRYCTNHDPERHCPDPEAMKARIAERTAKALAAVPAGAEMRKTLEEIANLHGEINPSNYDHDDACELNRQFCYAQSVAAAALATPASTEQE